MCAIEPIRIDYLMSLPAKSRTLKAAWIEDEHLIMTFSGGVYSYIRAVADDDGGAHLEQWNVDKENVLNGYYSQLRSACLEFGIITSEDQAEYEETKKKRRQESDAEEVKRRREEYERLKEEFGDG